MMVNIDGQLACTEQHLGDWKSPPLGVSEDFSRDDWIMKSLS
jgi:hypothetical protein